MSQFLVVFLAVTFLAFTQAQAQAVDTKTTANGAVFKRADISNFGEAWQDPTGLIWSDVATDSDGTIEQMNFAEATNHCVTIGARLPTREEFKQLRIYFGFNDPSRYQRQILPNLDINLFWSSSFFEGKPDVPWYFNAHYGYMMADVTDGIPAKEELHAARCVIKLN